MTTPPPLRAALDPALDALLASAGTSAVGASPATTLPWVVDVGAIAPAPGSETAALWRLLAETARRDVAAARMLEPHLDARAILTQAVAAGAGGRVTELADDDTLAWGVYAAEAPGSRLEAQRVGDGWRLDGTKPWCSLAADLDAALVTAWVGEERALFAVDLRAAGVSAHPGPWHPRGLAQVVSAPIDFAEVPAVGVGAPGWYLTRPGFSWGGMGVAAVWWGGVLPVVAALGARSRRDQLAASAAGEADAASWAAEVVLADAAVRVDAGDSGALLAERVRAVVSGAVRTVLRCEEELLGPGAVTTDEAYARRLADLALYLRQDHAARDRARLGRLAYDPAAQR